MANLGDVGPYGGGLWTDAVSSPKQWYIGPFTMPSPGGTVTDMYIECGPISGSNSVDFCIWVGSGLAYRNQNHFIGATQLQHQGSVNLWVPGGSSVYIGLWRNNSGGSTANLQWHTGGPRDVLYQLTGGAPASIGGGSNEYGTNHFGDMAGYLVYTPLAAPTISSISPSVSPPGSNVTVTGTDFLHATGVTVGGVAASYTIDSDTQITVTIPSNVGGTVALVVTNPAGSASATMTAGQIYTNPSSGVASIKAVKIGKSDGSGTVLSVLGVYAPTNPDGSGGVKRIW